MSEFLEKITNTGQQGARINLRTHCFLPETQREMGLGWSKFQNTFPEISWANFTYTPCTLTYLQVHPFTYNPWTLDYIETVDNSPCTSTSTLVCFIKGSFKFSFLCLNEWVDFVCKKNCISRLYFIFWEKASFIKKPNHSDQGKKPWGYKLNPKREQSRIKNKILYKNTSEQQLRLKNIQRNTPR